MTHGVTGVELREIEEGTCHCGCGQQTTLITRKSAYSKRWYGQHRWFVHGHHRMIAPDGELMVTPHTGWCSSCSTRKPLGELMPKTKRRKAREVAPGERYFVIYEKCIECYTRKRRIYDSQPERVQKVAIAFNERYRDDPYFRQSCLDRARERRERVKQDPELLEKLREQNRKHRRNVLARKRELKAQIKSERELEVKDPLALAPSDPENERVLNLAMKHAGGPARLEEYLGFSKNGLKRYRAGSRGLSLDLLDRLLMLIGEPMFDTYDFRRTSEWRALAKKTC